MAQEGSGEATAARAQPRMVGSAALHLPDNPIAGLIGAAAGKLHTVLVDECLQQAIQLLHDVPVTGDLVRAVLLDQANTLHLDVAGHYA